MLALLLVFLLLASRRNLTPLRAILFPIEDHSFDLVSSDLLQYRLELFFVSLVGIANQHFSMTVDDLLQTGLWAVCKVDLGENAVRHY